MVSYYKILKLFEVSSTETEGWAYPKPFLVSPRMCYVPPENFYDVIFCTRLYILEYSDTTILSQEYLHQTKRIGSFQAVYYVRMHVSLRHYESNGKPKECRINVGLLKIHIHSI